MRTVKCRSGDIVWIGDDVGIGIAHRQDESLCVVVHAPNGLTFRTSSNSFVQSAHLEIKITTYVVLAASGENIEVGNYRVVVEPEPVALHGSVELFDVVLRIDAPSDIPVKRVARAVSPL